MRIEIDPNVLRPMITEIVRQTVAQCATLGQEGDRRLSWREDEAAALLGLQPHQLRDLRRKGVIQGTKLGRSWHYSRAQLLAIHDQGTN